MEACAVNNLLCYYTDIQKTMSPRKSEEDAMIKFCKFWEGQKQWFAANSYHTITSCSQKIVVLKNFANFTEKHLC